MSERQGVEIDYCPNCRGVWLDRGELDKLLERASSYAASPANSGTVHHDKERQQKYVAPSREYDHSSGYRKHYHQKSWLSEIFD